MCGIAGFSLNPNDNDITNARKVAGRMLLDIQSRGRDATGAAWYTASGEVTMQKHPVAASAFTRNLSMWKKAKYAILHTRNWTQGSPSDPNNNHPISTGGLFGVHNGCIHNDYELFQWDIPKAPRFGEVDSEAAFAALAWGSAEGNRLGTLKKQLEAIEGSAALAWLDNTDPEETLHLARVYSSPLIIARTTGGSILFASTSSAIRDSVKDMGVTFEYEWELGEGQYLAIQHGEIVDAHEFKPAGFSYRSFGSQAATSKAAGHTTAVQTVADGRSEYESWKESNEAMVEAYFAEWDRAALQDKYDPTKYDLDSRMLDVDSHVDYDPADFAFDYRVRAQAIERFVKYNDVPMAIAHGMNLRPGDWVTTQFADDWYWGQLVSIPDTFPAGKYVIRLILTRAGYSADVALIHRGVEDLDWSEELDKRTGPASLDLADISLPGDDLGDRVSRAITSLAEACDDAAETLAETTANAILSELEPASSDDEDAELALLYPTSEYAPF